MKQYYIISLKHTSIEDSALTLWRRGNKGYCWYKDWAGIYSEEEAESATNHTHPDNVCVPVEVADKLFVTVLYDGEQRLVLPNRDYVWAELNLEHRLMKEAKYRTCYMSIK